MWACGVVRDNSQGISEQVVICAKAGIQRRGKFLTTLDSCLTSRSAVEKRVAGMTGRSLF